MKQAVIYARVSSIEQEQEGFSIPSQVKSLRSLAETYSCKVAAEFVESASARKAGRKKFNDVNADRIFPIFADRKFPSCSSF
ncbi:MAG: recombinase family protein [Nitrospirota bacterium]|nr:recombinase family protein [Nitrospirota bacterium]